MHQVSISPVGLGLSATDKVGKMESIEMWTNKLVVLDLEMNFGSVTWKVAKCSDVIGFH